MVLRDLEPSLIERGLGSIQRSMGKLLEKGKLDQQAHHAALARIATTTRLADLQDCDRVIEAIVEHEPSKLELFRELDPLCSPVPSWPPTPPRFPLPACADRSVLSGCTS